MYEFGSELDSLMVLSLIERVVSSRRPGAPAVCRQTQIVFLWLGVNQWGEGILGPGWPVGRRSLGRVLPRRSQPGLSRPEAAVLPRPRPSPVFALLGLLVPA